MNLKGSKTEQNLYKAFSGESRARNKYNLYAEKARQQGYHHIASIFSSTAGNEFAHARRVFNDFLTMNKSTEENIINAAMGEAFESEKLYKEFEETARKEGFSDISNFFKELREVEEKHKERFSSILDSLKQGTVFRRDENTNWHCMNCGYIHNDKESPNKCPLCTFPQGYFDIYGKKF